MIESIRLFKNHSWQNLHFVQAHKHMVELGHLELNTAPFTIEINFSTPIVLFRTNGYIWQKLSQRMLSNWYAPKVIKLNNNQMVQANLHYGIWEVDAKKPKTLLWHFNQPYSKPVAQFDSNNSKRIVQAVSRDSLHKPLALLLPKVQAIEVSRSKVPFSAIACFTDHCDFDTLENLQQQRLFFKKYQIKITKGFFLNHYSKRSDTASCEMHRSEYAAWLKDGHELAYHSLSQSIKGIDESIKDFETFQPPFNDLDTWIDHGFQIYNASLYQNHKNIKDNFGSILKSKSISVLWNYIDSGTVVKGVINQLNPRQFTLKTYYNGIKHLKFKEQVPMLIKNVIFHYYNSEDSVRPYRNLAKYFKSLKYKKSSKTHFKAILAIFKLFRLIVPIVFYWKTKKNRIYPLANYAPLIFNQHIQDELFTYFQTIEMIDFKNGLDQSNVDLLIKEKGLFIAHTYFSAPFNYHHGKLFHNKGEIDKKVENNFKNLSDKMMLKEVWNPTLKELIDQLNNFKSISFTCNDSGELNIIDENQLAYRNIQ